MEKIKTHRTLRPSMCFTLKLVKYLLFGVLYIAVCSFLLVVRTSHKGVAETIVVEKNENSRESELDNSLLESFFNFEKESVVEFKDSDIGGVIKTEELQRKLRRVNETCDKYNLTEKLTRKHFLYSPRHEALYCWIRKVASTSFTKFFGDLRDRRVARNYYREVNFLAPRSIEELKRIIKDARSFKFLVVRHPFQRLVSSYRDRIEDNSRYTAQAWIYAPRIFHLTRPELFHSNGTSGNGLRQIFNPHKRLKLIPSFREFVVWLLSEPSSKDDVHWYQYHKQCSICNANFDYILDLDNYTVKEVRYIFAKLGLDENSAYLPNIQSTRGGKTDYARTCDYFANLSSNIVRRLYDRYKIDFEMFDYKYEDYVNCTERPDS